jgi:hypothetical protein
MKKVLRLGVAAAMSAGLGMGCADPAPAPGGVELRDSAAENPLSAGADFVAIPREASAQELAARHEALSPLGLHAQALVGGPSSFYLAIRKSALERKWFMSGFVNSTTETTSLFSGGGRPAGSDVVSFRVQNGKLFIYRAQAGQKWSDAFDPSIIVDAYPLVLGIPAFDRLGGAGDYVLVDPSQGLNNIVLTPGYVFSEYPAEYQSRLDVDLVYLQNFTKLDDGISFQTVVAGTYEGIDPASLFAIHPSMAITTTLSFRPYAEGEGFVPMAPPPVEHFILGPRQVIENERVVTSTAAIKWNLREGMQPIEYLITRNVEQLAAQYDLPLVELIKEGVESWNSAFGFRALTARVARPDEPVGRDDRNFIIVDSDVRAGSAFGAPRVNPNTGEIRGASIYLPASFFADNSFSDDPAVAGAESGEHVLLGVRWNGLTQLEPTCSLRPQERPVPAELAADSPDELTAREKLGRYLAHMVAHEVGHTLGLRHNFKGSLVPPTSSVMEYTIGADAVAAHRPQAYDVAAIRYLYGMSTELPTQPFCTDMDTSSDPECFVFDSTANPLEQLWGPWYTYMASLATQLGGISDYEIYYDYYATPLFGYVRAGTPEQAHRAWDVLMAGVSAPLTAEQASNPQYVAGADALVRYVLQRLYSVDAGTRTGAVWTSRALPLGDPSEPELVARITDQLAQLVRNVDGARSFETRRLVVDILRDLQSVAAYEALLATQAELSAALAGGTLTGSEAALSRDLLARIDAATSPYFD